MTYVNAAAIPYRFSSLRQLQRVRNKQIPLP